MYMKIMLIKILMRDNLLQKSGKYYPVRLEGIEPSASVLSGQRSTTELQALLWQL